MNLREFKAQINSISPLEDDRIIIIAATDSIGNEVAWEYTNLEFVESGDLVEELDGSFTETFPIAKIYLS